MEPDHATAKRFRLRAVEPGRHQFCRLHHVRVQLLHAANRTGLAFVRGAFSAFLVALFAEMYGYPLTIYLLSGWLHSRFPDVDWFSHDAGHLLEMIFSWRANRISACFIS
jgi:hypothetical protein